VAYNSNYMIDSFRAIYADSISDLVRAPDSDSFWGIRRANISDQSLAGRVLSIETIQNAIYATVGITPVDTGSYKYLKAMRDTSSLEVGADIKFDEEYV
jgi:hypothetical protein